MLLSLLLAAPASAFCGAYVGEIGSTPQNHLSRMVVARADNETVLTLFNDAEGAGAADFGVLIPLPEVIYEGDMRVTERALLERIDAYTAPRAVRYDCADLYPLEAEVAEAAGKAADTADSGPSSSGSPAAAPTSSSSSGGCMGGGSSWADDTGAGGDRYVDTADDGVDVVDTYELAEYTAFALSADDAGALEGWLATNGFSVPESTTAVLQEYLDRGDHVLALRVAVDRLPAGGFLTPLQIRYHGEGWTLPIRLGATSSVGLQDLLLYVLTPPETGAASISNYRETLLPIDGCMVPEDELGSWYDTQLDAAMDLPADLDALAGRTGLAWVTEYSWTGGSCDPCPEDGPLTQSEAGELAPFGHYGYHITRLHLRYTPDAVTQDVALYSTGITDTLQVRLVAHEWELESDFPMCDGSVPEAPGSCFTADWWARKAEDDVGEDVPLRASEGCDCNAAAFVIVLPLLLAPWRRRA